MNYCHHLQKKKDSTGLNTGGGQTSSPTQSSSNPPSLFGKFPTKDELGYKQENVLPSINSMKQPAIKDEARIVKPIVGETLIAETPARRFGARRIENVTVTKVGRKYFSVLFDGRREAS